MQKQRKRRAHRAGQYGKRQPRSAGPGRQVDLQRGRAQMRFNTSVLLVPPKPKELDTAIRTGMSRAVFAQ